MVSMGFPKEKCLAAMRAAFNNPERAIDYLLNVFLLKLRGFLKIFNSLNSHNNLNKFLNNKLLNKANKVNKTYLKF